MRLLKALHETERFSTTELPVIQFLLEHPADIADMTIRDLADKTFTSPASIFRLCQKLNMKGYNDFKIKFISETNRVSLERRHSTRRPIKSNDTPAEIMRKIAELEVEAIEETKNEINQEQLIRIADYIMQAKQVDIYAYDQNFSLAEMIVYNFQQLKCNATANLAMTSQISQAMNSSKENVAILLSRSGLNQRLIRTAQILQKRHVKSIVFTSFADSPLVKLCDEYCYVANTREFLDLGGMIYSVGLRYYIDVLCGIILSRSFSKCEEFYKMLIKVQGDNDDKDRLW